MKIAENIYTSFSQGQFFTYYDSVLQLSENLSFIVKQLKTEKSIFFSVLISC
jgi:hypothetical protein